jgi:ABC-type Fe3+ transport system permease subunit
MERFSGFRACVLILIWSHRRIVTGRRLLRKRPSWRELLGQLKRLGLCPCRSLIFLCTVLLPLPQVVVIVEIFVAEH